MTHREDHAHWDRRLAAELASLEWFEENFHPPRIEALQEQIHPLAADPTPLLMETAGASGAAAEDIQRAALMLREALQVLASASTTEIDPLLGSVLRALRKTCAARELLYRRRMILPAVNLHFLEPAARADAARFDGNAGDDAGIVHLNESNDPYRRGTVTVYVPEWDYPRPAPMVAALHGGLGHGRDFIWTLLREARTRGFILAAPSSLGRTWSIIDPEEEMKHLFAAVDAVCSRWPVDRKRMLLTGFSDGATFTITAAMTAESPFLAYAPVAGTLSPESMRHVAGRHIRWMQGELDWMFPSHRAEREASWLANAGADVTFRILKGQSHAYPRRENGALLDWFSSLVKR